MQTSYIYSVSRVNALSEFLLNKTDIDRLLVAEPGDDLQSALKETYLAPYVVRVPNEDLALAIEQTLIDAKRLVHRITPNGNMFRVLWVQYDIHNLRVVAKATATGQSFEAYKQYMSERGIYDPVYLHARIEERELNTLQPSWQEAYDMAVSLISEGKLAEVDGVFDELYFTTSKRIAATIGDSFIKKYTAALIDLFNLKSRLRHLKNDGVKFNPEFVSGGTISRDLLETIEDVKTAFARLGGTDHWQQALAYFEETDNFTHIDAQSADYLLMLAKNESRDMFSSASLVLYYLKCRQAAANVRMIVVGRNSGIPVEDIRSNLRMAYVNN